MKWSASFTVHTNQSNCLVQFHAYRTSKWSNNRTFSSPNRHSNWKTNQKFVDPLSLFGENHTFKIVYWCETCKRHSYKFTSIVVHTVWKQNRRESSHISRLISVYNVEHWTMSVRPRVYVSPFVCLFMIVVSSIGCRYWYSNTDNCPFCGWISI